MDAVEESFESLLGRLSDSSRRAYSDDWTRFNAWLRTHRLAVGAVKPRHVEQFMNYLRDERGLKKASLQRALSVMREAFSALVRDEIIESNPAREVKLHRSRAKPHAPYLNEDEARRLYQFVPETWRERRDRVCLVMLLLLGWRRAEIARLRVEDFRDGRIACKPCQGSECAVCGGSGYVTFRTVTGVMKGGERLTVGVPSALQEILDEWLGFAGIECGPVLPRSETNSRAVSGDIVYQIVRRAAKRAGLKISPHGLRRTKITLEGERDVPLKQRQLAVGHVSQTTTEQYDKARDAAKNAPGQVLADLVLPAGD